MPELLTIALVIFSFAMVSKQRSLSSVTAPMVFTAIGVLLGYVGGTWFQLDLENQSVSLLIEATLVLVLFTDAARINLQKLRYQFALPLRLLGIGLPLTIALGTLAAVLLFPGLAIIEAMLIAAILAPTDAALGQAVVSDQKLPVRIRQSLNVESGLNDGIMVPVVTIFLAIAAAQHSESPHTWGIFTAQQLGFGVLSGALAGLLGGWLLHRRTQADRVDNIYQQLATIAIAVVAYTGAEVIGGNGFVAAFVAGLAFGHVAHQPREHIPDFTQDEGELLEAITFLIFGAVLVPPVLGSLTWPIGCYVVLSLTVVRMLPVLLSLSWSGTQVQTRFFIAWFGPRGLASILFALLVFEQLTGTAAETVFNVAVWTILVSIFAHGITANPWATRLARHLDKIPATAPELVEVHEMPTRRRL